MFDVGRFNLKFDFEVKVLVQSWGLTLKIEAVDKRLTLKPEVEVLFKVLKFKVSSKSLKFDVLSKIWGLKLKFKIWS